MLEVVFVTIQKEQCWLEKLKQPMKVYLKSLFLGKNNANWVDELISVTKTQKIIKHAQPV